MEENTTYTDRTTAIINGTKIHPPLLALICFAVTLAFHLIAGGPHMVFAHQVVGLLVTCAGVGLSGYAAAIFAARDTTRNPYGDPSSFVAIAPYTVTRNPMYLGLTLILLGLAAFFGSAVMLLAPIVFFVVIDRRVIPREEEAMELKFGLQYQEYKARVRRWV
jgi:protein-S-isoprenylcysteine O-methyltransferase Ste14